MRQNWWRSVYKQNQSVLKLGVSIFLVGIGFRLLYSQPAPLISDVSDSSIDTPVMGKDLNPIPSGFVESPNELDVLPNKGFETTKELDEVPHKDNKSDRCDLSTGQWVPNLANPTYTNNTCRWIESHQNCVGNGRPDTGYLYWRWRPRDCELPQFNAKKFLEMMRDKTWTLVGDSITRNHLQSLLCLLSQAEDAVELYHDKDYKNRRWHIRSYNFTISVIWSPFLSKAAIFEDINGVSTSEIKLHIDVLDKSWTQQFQKSDYIMFSSGKWFIKTAIYYENNTILGCHYCQGKNYTDLGFNFAYHKILRNLFDFILNSEHKGMVFYRTSTPDHFENGEWSSGGSCKRTMPAKEGEFELKDLNRILRKIELEEFDKVEARALEKGVKLKLLDVTPLSLLRPDGHPGPYRHFYPFAKDENTKVQYDCLHWCLPGPIDSWNDLLMELVVNS